jgi:hypothetical protein
MDEPTLPETPQHLRKTFSELRQDRNRRQSDRRAAPVARRALRPKARATILSKTAGRCHICGGEVIDRWDADHVLAHSSGGGHAADNYLPAHRLCNNYRWDYSPEEFQWVLKLGVWARTHIEKGGPFGEELARRFHQYDVRRHARRKEAPIR